MEKSVKLQVSAIMLGVADVGRARKFYAEGLGCEIDQDFPGFVRCTLGDGSSKLALYEWDAAARDAGVSPEGTGFRGVSLHYFAGSRAEVDEVVRAAEAAGGTVVTPAADAGWGYYGYFGDPDGHLWKVTTTG